MQNNPTISLIIPTYNRSHFLIRAINSILNQTYKNFELIIVDDASTDNTEQTIKPFLKDKRIHYYKQRINKGALAALNRGFDLAKGNLIVHLDDDDELMRRAFEIIAKKFNELSPKGIKMLWFDRIDALTGKVTGYGISNEGYIDYKKVLCGKIKGDFLTVVDRSIINNENQFDERFWMGAGLLWLKLLRKYKTYYIPESLHIYHRESQGRMSNIPLQSSILQKVIQQYKFLLKEHGDDIKSLCPKVYGKHLRSLGYYQVLNGEKKEGLKILLKALKYNFSVKTLKLIFLSLMLNKEQLRGGNIGFLSPIRKLFILVKSILNC